MSGSVERIDASVKLKRAIGFMEKRVKLESDLRRVGVVVDLSACSRLLGLFLKQPAPALGQFGNPIADPPGAVVKLGRDRREEAASTKHTALDVAGPRFDQGPEPGKAGVIVGGGLHHPGLEDLACGLDSSQLEIFLGTEVCEETALAHGERVGEAGDS